MAARLLHLTHMQTRTYTHTNGSEFLGTIRQGNKLSNQWRLDSTAGRNRKHFRLLLLTVFPSWNGLNSCNVLMSEIWTWWLIWTTFDASVFKIPGGFFLWAKILSHWQNRKGKGKKMPVQKDFFFYTFSLYIVLHDTSNTPKCTYKFFVCKTSIDLSTF